MNDLAGRVALVTGASRGIGEAIAKRFAREGVKLALVGRDRSALDRVASGIDARVFAMDLTDSPALDATLDAIETALGPVDILVNNAGVAESAALEATDDAVIERTFAVNVWPVFRLCRATVPKMAKRGWGRVINVASNAGLTGYPYTSAYCASKHAVVGLTRALAAEFARSGVTINAICPGFVDTEMTVRAIDNIVAKTGRTREQARAALEAQSPQRRLMTVDEVAHAVWALVPHEARGIHGQAIALDGGQVIA
ncbi:MAG: SDR family oxidoreductase [Myxococcales bacterium]|nr:SDR family oxidoreductase [Myxococcales bacterium]